VPDGMFVTVVVVAGMEDDGADGGDCCGHCFRCPFGQFEATEIFRIAWINLQKKVRLRVPSGQLALVQSVWPTSAP
jgi:hypothetical protein